MDSQVETPAERALRLDLAARLAETPDLAAAIQELAVHMRPAAWQAARERYAATHRPFLFVA